MLFSNPGYQILWLNPFLACPQHDWGAVGIISADIDTVMPSHFLKSYPYISLDILHQVAYVDRAVGVGQGTGDQDFSLFIAHGWIQLWLLIYKRGIIPHIMRHEHQAFRFIYKGLEKTN
jgi:hypothetical protein